MSTYQHSTSKTYLCVWGSTGNGKSATCNSLAGIYFGVKSNTGQSKNSSALFEPYNEQNTRDEIFKTSADTRSCTMETTIYECNWFQNSALPGLVLVDTPGLGDTRGTVQDHKNMVSMVAKLKSLPGINLFLLCFNGQAPRFDNYLRELIILFKNSFGDEIWNNVALVFTNWPADVVARKKLIRKYGDNPEKRLAESFFAEIKTEVGANVNKAFFLDNDSNLEQEYSGPMINNMLRIMTTAKSLAPFSCHKAIPGIRKIDEEKKAHLTQIKTTCESNLTAAKNNLKRAKDNYDGAIRDQQNVKTDNFYQQIKVKHRTKVLGLFNGHPYYTTENVFNGNAYNATKQSADSHVNKMRELLDSANRNYEKTVQMYKKAEVQLKNCKI